MANHAQGCRKAVSNDSFLLFAGLFSFSPFPSLSLSFFLESHSLCMLSLEDVTLVKFFVWTAKRINLCCWSLHGVV